MNLDSGTFLDHLFLVNILILYFILLILNITLIYRERKWCLWLELPSNPLFIFYFYFKITIKLKVLNSPSERSRWYIFRTVGERQELLSPLVLSILQALSHNSAANGVFLNRLEFTLISVTVCLPPFSSHAVMALYTSPRYCYYLSLRNSNLIST